MLSRSRIAGLEPRLGTKSMYMRQNLADLRRFCLSHADALHGYITASRHAYRVEMPGLSAFPPPELRASVPVGATPARMMKRALVLS
jgi:hypothetical protein